MEYVTQQNIEILSIDMKD